MRRSSSVIVAQIRSIFRHTSIQQEMMSQVTIGGSNKYPKVKRLDLGLPRNLNQEISCQSGQTKHSRLWPGMSNKMGLCRRLPNAFRIGQATSSTATDIVVTGACTSECHRCIMLRWNAICLTIEQGH
jgi:hypothetical protein